MTNYWRVIVSPGLGFWVPHSRKTSGATFIHIKKILITAVSCVNAHLRRSISILQVDGFVLIIKKKRFFQAGGLVKCGISHDTMLNSSLG